MGNQPKPLVVGSGAWWLGQQGRTSPGWAQGLQYGAGQGCRWHVGRARNLRVWGSDRRLVTAWRPISALRALRCTLRGISRKLWYLLTLHLSGSRTTCLESFLSLSLLNYNSIPNWMNSVTSQLVHRFWTKYIIYCNIFNSKLLFSPCLPTADITKPETEIQTILQYSVENPGPKSWSSSEISQMKVHPSLITTVKMLLR